MSKYLPDCVKTDTPWKKIKKAITTKTVEVDAGKLQKDLADLQKEAQNQDAKDVLQMYIERVEQVKTKN